LGFDACACGGGIGSWTRRRRRRRRRRRCGSSCRRLIAIAGQILQNPLGSLGVAVLGGGGNCCCHALRGSGVVSRDVVIRRVAIGVHLHALALLRCGCALHAAASLWCVAQHRAVARL